MIYKPPKKPIGQKLADEAFGLRLQLTIHDKMKSIMQMFGNWTDEQHEASRQKKIKRLEKIQKDPRTWQGWP